MPGGEAGRLGRSPGLELQSRSALTIRATVEGFPHISEPQPWPPQGLLWEAEAGNVCEERLCSGLAAGQMADGRPQALALEP